MPLKLHVVTCSTRPGRVGPAVAGWFDGFARAHGKFDVRLVDLAEVGLPLYDEPHHPATRRYEKEHTKRWSAIVSEADAYVFVTPEYNGGPTPAFVNALNYLLHEWAYKPCAFVSYGGISGGLRAVQPEKLLVTTLKMMPIPESVPIPGVHGMLDENKALKPNKPVEDGAAKLLDELLRWAEALKPMRG